LKVDGAGAVEGLVFDDPDDADGALQHAIVDEAAAILERAHGFRESSFGADNSAAVVPVVHLESAAASCRVSIVSDREWLCRNNITKEAPSSPSPTPLNSSSTPSAKGWLMPTLTEPAHDFHDQPPLLFRERCGDGVVHISLLLARVMDEFTTRREQRP
jgi:hypothetical protein